MGKPHQAERAARQWWWIGSGHTLLPVVLLQRKNSSALESPLASIGLLPEMSDNLPPRGENGDDRAEGRYMALLQPGGF